MRYRDLVDIQQDSSADGEAENFTGKPLLENVPCEIRTVSGDESFRGRQIEAHLTHVVEMHDYPGVVSTMRLVDRGRMAGRIMNIRHVRQLDVDAFGRRKMLQLYCEELAPQ